MIDQMSGKRTTVVSVLAGFVLDSWRLKIKNVKKVVKSSKTLNCLPVVDLQEAMPLVAIGQVDPCQSSANANGSPDEN